MEFLGDERGKRSNNRAEAQLYGKQQELMVRLQLTPGLTAAYVHREVLTFEGWPVNAEVESIESIGYPDHCGRAEWW